MSKLFQLSPQHAVDLNIVAFSGRKGCGKSTLARHVVTKHGFMPEMQARHLKAQCVAFEGLPLEEVYGSHKSVETRNRMVEIGHGTRLTHGEDIWLKALEGNLFFARESGVQNIVLTDIRYPNEVRFVQDALGGKVYRVVGRGDETSQEPGEIALDAFAGFAGYINNSGDVLFAEAQVDQVLARDFTLMRRAA